jgi:hypothetical protein
LLITSQPETACGGLDFHPGSCDLPRAKPSK